MSQKVVLIPSDNTACGLYRIRWPAEAVKAARPDWNIEIANPENAGFQIMENGDLYATRGFDLRDADVVVFQRVGSKPLMQLMTWCKKNGKRVVVEVDDDLAEIHPANRAKSAWGPEQLKWFRAAFKMADVVTATTQPLVDRYAPHIGVVIPNLVPRAVLDLPRAVRPTEGLLEGPVAGWSGFVGTHPADLAEAKPFVRRWERYGYQLAGMADPDGIAKVWWPGEGLEERRERLYRIGAAALGPEYYQHMGWFDVGLVPLEDSKFNKAKSWLKVLEWSAVGVPVVASATPDNVAGSMRSDFDSTGRGLIYPTPRNALTWQRAADMLAEPLVRQELSQHNKAVVRERWTIEGNVERWIDAWSVK